MSTIFDFFDPRSTTSRFLQKSFPNLRLNKSTEKFWQIPKSPSIETLHFSCFIEGKTVHSLDRAFLS